MIIRCQQLAGINSVFFYSISSSQQLDSTGSMALQQQTLLITGFKIVGVVSGILLVDRGT